MTPAVEPFADPVAAFIGAAAVPRDAHGAGTLEDANAILARHPDVVERSLYAAAMLGDEAAVRGFLARDPACVVAKGGPSGWDALTSLCFSRYLRLDASRSDAFVRTARALLDAGARADTGWYETIDYETTPRQILESAIYGAAGVAQHAGLTRLLLERGADPNDEETPYHVPETRDNTVMRILLESGRLNATSLSWLLIRKCDWHDLEGLRLVLDHGGDPNLIPRVRVNAFHHAIRRDNGIEAITLLVDRGADPSIPNELDGRTAEAMAAHRGRGDILALVEERRISTGLHGVDRLIAACAMDDRDEIRSLTARSPHLERELVERGGTLLAEFAGVGNLPGVRRLLDCGVSPAALYAEGDPYFGAATDSTALHVAAWRGRPDVVRELIARGTPVNAVDGQGRTAMMLAVKACVDSYWMEARSPDSVKALVAAGASAAGVQLPCGYDAVDALLQRAAG